nr:hypothetical protein [Candidatus Sigynarchaeota archaeon]
MNETWKASLLLASIGGALFSMIIIFAQYLFPAIYWAMEFIEDPTQANLYAYLFSLLTFIGSSIGFGIFFLLVKRPMHLIVHSITWLALAILLLMYSVSIYKEFYPFTMYQVSIFHGIMFFIPPAMIGISQYGSALVKRFPANRLLLSALIGGLIAAVTFFLASSWWGYAFVIPAASLLVAAVLGSAGFSAKLLKEKEPRGEEKENQRVPVGNPFPLNLRFLLPTLSAWLANTPAQFFSFFTSTLEEWTLNASMFSLGMVITAFGSILYSVNRKKEALFYPRVYAGACIALGNALLLWLVPGYSRIVLNFILAGFSSGVLLFCFVHGLFIGTGKRLSLHVGLILLVSFIISGVVAALYPILGELGVTGEKRDTIMSFLAFAAVIVAGLSTAMLVLSQFTARAMARTFPYKILAGGTP